MEWIFRFLCVLQNEGFYGGRSANPATNLLISNPTAGGRPQTRARDMDGHWLTRSSSALWYHGPVTMS